MMTGSEEGKEGASFLQIFVEHGFSGSRTRAEYKSVVPREKGTAATHSFGGKREKRNKKGEFRTEWEWDCWHQKDYGEARRSAKGKDSSLPPLRHVRRRLLRTTPLLAAAGSLKTKGSKGKRERECPCSFHFFFFFLPPAERVQKLAAASHQLFSNASQPAPCITLACRDYKPARL